MSKRPPLALWILFFLFAALGAVQGVRVQHLREAESLYRWMLAAAVNERLFQEEDTQYKDKELFELCNQEASGLADLLPKKPVETGSPDQSSTQVSNIGQISQSIANDKRIWDMTRSSDLAPARAKFAEFSRKRQLRFAQDIEYSEAQGSGVNIFNMFFGFRKVAANFLWIQVDRYWHQGNMYRMIALMKTCVALDPHFIEAYQIGSWHMAYNATAKMMDTPWPERQWDAKYKACVGEKEKYYYFAIDFLKDGIRKNPRNYKLYFELGFANYKVKLKDYANAVKYLTEAVRLPHERWVPRQLYICMELNGQYEDAMKGWQEFSKRFPESEITRDVAPRFIRQNQGKMLEKKSEEAATAAAAATDPAEAERLRAEAEKYRLEALHLWNTMGGDGDVRRLRLEAIDLARQSRYLEAIALLDKARWQQAEIWDEASKLIMQYKKAGNIPLSLSEQKSLLREKDAGVCTGMPEAERQRVQAANTAAK